MALLKRGPKWSSATTQDSQLLQRGLALSGRDSRHLLLENLEGVAVPPDKKLGEDVGGQKVRKHPDHRSLPPHGAQNALLHLLQGLLPFLCYRVGYAPLPRGRITTAYLGLLNRGKKWTPDKTPATQQLQEAHLANINRLAALKKLVVAGPFGDDGNLRGVFVFRVATLEEARALAETDPAVQAGRLEIDMHPWPVPEGILP